MHQQVTGLADEKMHQAVCQVLICTTTGSLREHPISHVPMLSVVKS